MLPAMADGGPTGGIPLDVHRTTWTTHNIPYSHSMPHVIIYHWFSLIIKSPHSWNNAAWLSLSLNSLSNDTWRCQLTPVPVIQSPRMIPPLPPCYNSSFLLLRLPLPALACGSKLPVYPICFFFTKHPGKASGLREQATNYGTKADCRRGTGSGVFIARKPAFEENISIPRRDNIASGEELGKSARSQMWITSQKLKQCHADEIGNEPPGR